MPSLASPYGPRSVADSFACRLRLPQRCELFISDEVTASSFSLAFTSYYPKQLHLPRLSTHLTPRTDHHGRAKDAPTKPRSSNHRPKSGVQGDVPRHQSQSRILQDCPSSPPHSSKLPQSRRTRQRRLLYFSLVPVEGCWVYRQYNYRWRTRW